ncbi:alpha/beta fold hydrolase [Vitreoscilla filiformis]|jgi:pimeloyl-ACP methyl ester carboxylesterase|nr:alpha/beta hydrolase [Vitreoscilla filiformis]
MIDSSSPDSRPGQRPGRSVHLPVRGWHYHLTVWGEVSLITPERPALVLCHGWMDVGTSFQFLVDALAALEGPTRCIIAPDWRGYGRTQGPACDNYWFPDYLGDLEALLHHPELGLPANLPIDLLGHSMGGNVAMMYAGIRPQRIRRLINLEGFGMPASRPEQAPARLAQWLDALATPQYLKSYASLADVAERLCHNNPRLSRARAEWLAPHWATQREDGRWHLLSDPAHKRIGAQLYRVEEVLACWRHITAPVLWMDGDLTDTRQWWGDRYPRSEFEQRLSHVPHVKRHRLSPCGHMLHHDQPEAVAAHLLDFLQAPADQLASRG